jgi:RNA polymerase sigma factor (sigma-70 family)
MRRNDAVLIDGCLRGEEDAWNELFDLHYPPTIRFLAQLSPGADPGELEEAAQEAFVSVVKNLGKFRRGSHLQTWIFRIAANKMRDQFSLRAAAKRGGGAVPVSLSAASGDLPPPDPADNTLGPSELAEAAELGTAVRAALDQLGDPCREIIELRYFGDLSYEEIATELGLNPKTVSSRLSKCLDRFEPLAKSIMERFPV